ncbi:MAG: hypothetical protein QXL94_00575 [Candidatus Parvarchaeum sp.]
MCLPCSDKKLLQKLKGCQTHGPSLKLSSVVPITMATVDNAYAILQSIGGESAWLAHCIALPSGDIEAQYSVGGMYLDLVIGSSPVVFSSFSDLLNTFYVTKTFSYPKDLGVLHGIKDYFEDLIAPLIIDKKHLWCECKNKVI